MEAGLSGQTHLAVCVLGAGATGSFVEKPVGWGQEACDHPEAQAGLWALEGGGNGGRRGCELQGQHEWSWSVRMGLQPEDIPCVAEVVSLK